jgi:hypothetical protein
MINQDTILDVRTLGNIHRDISLTALILNISQGHFDFNIEIQREASWIPALSDQQVVQMLVRQMMLASHSMNDGSIFADWYIKVRDRSFGPFPILQLLEFYQQGRVDELTLVTHPLREARWQTLGQVHPFTKSSFSQLMSCKEITAIASRRKAPRVNFSGEVFMSNNGDLYRGVCWSLSQGGLGVLSDKSTNMSVGDRVNMIINSSVDHGAVQVKGHVVSLAKEGNYDRVALQFEEESPCIGSYLNQRLPCPLAR